MGVYAIKRILLFIPTLLLMSILIFALLRILPGDPAEVMMGEEGARFTEEDLQQIRAEIGTDKPLHIQYAVWIANIFQGISVSLSTIGFPSLMTSSSDFPRQWSWLSWPALSVS